MGIIPQFKERFIHTSYVLHNAIIGALGLKLATLDAVEPDSVKANKPLDWIEFERLHDESAIASSTSKLLL